MALKQLARYDKLKKHPALSILNDYLFNIYHEPTQLNCRFLKKNLHTTSYGVFSNYNITKKFINLTFLRNFASYPDHIKVTLPALSPTMEKGNIQSWSKKEGDAIKEGDSLAEIETDKAVLSFETIESGYLAKILLPAGIKDVPVGKLMCIMVKNQADVAAFKDYKDDSSPIAMPAAAAAPTAPSPAPSPAAAPVQATATSHQDSPMAKNLAEAQNKRSQGSGFVQSSQQGDRTYASPMAKQLAKAQNLRLQGKGSGLYQSIKSTDLAAMKSGVQGVPSKGVSGPPKVRGGNKYKDIPLTNIREIIGKRLLESKTTIPHFYVTVECRMDNILTLREKVNKQFKKEGIRISVNDFVIKAVATACIKVPEANSYWMGKSIRQFEHCDVSVAVSTDTGLLTPIVFNADEKGIIEISQDMKQLAKKARTNKLKPAEYQGGTVCISNMGMFGITCFCAVINPPQSLILAIGGTTQKCVPSKSPKGFTVNNVMMVTASADHRIVDGAVCARWLQFFRSFIEEPGSMLL